MKTYKSTQDKIVGQLGDDKIYRSKRKSSKHLLNIMDAWGVDKEIFDDLQASGCESLRVLDQDDMVVYSISRSAFEEHNVERDFGHSPQLFVSRKHWEAKEVT